MRLKLSALLLAAVVTAALILPACADVIWEPDNNFYESHREECGYVGRDYLTNGQKGYVTLYTAPDSLTEEVNAPNGARFSVGYVWQEDGGEQWAEGDYSVQDEAGARTWYTGWVPMSDLALIYDYIAFAEDHGSEFREYDGSGDGLTEVCLYSYPGGTYSHTLEEDKNYMPFSETFQELYTDENGLRWAFVGYYMGSRNAWACLDDPLNTELGADGPQTAGQVRGAGEVLYPAAEAPGARTAMVWLIPAVLVAAAAVVTAVIVRQRSKKT